MKETFTSESVVYSTGDIKRVTGFSESDIGRVFNRGHLPIGPATRTPTGNRWLLSFADVVDGRLLWELSAYMTAKEASKAIKALHAHLESLGASYRDISGSDTRRVAFIYPQKPAGFLVLGESDKARKSGLYLQLSAIIAEVAASL